MSRNVSLIARRAMNAQETDQVFLHLLDIDHPDLTEPIRVVNNTVAVVSEGNVYQAFPFQVDLPDEKEGQISTARLTIDAVDRSIIQVIRTISEAATISLKIILADTPDVIEAGPFDFTLRNVSYDAYRVSGTLVYEDRLDLRIPADSFDPQNFRGLF